MANPTLVCNFTPRFRTQSLCWSPLPNFVVLNHKEQTYVRTRVLGMQWSNKNTRNLVLRASSVPPEAPLPTIPKSSNPIVNEIIASMISMIMQYLSKTLGPIWIYKDKVEDALENVEGIVNAVENVAEEVDRVAEDILDDLPEGKLKHFVNFVEDMAETTAVRADSIGDFIDKVQEEGEELESFVESVGYLKNGNDNQQNNGIESLFSGLFPSWETFSYF